MPIYTLYQNLAISKGRSDVYMWLALDTTILSDWSVAVCPGRISTSVSALLTFTLPSDRKSVV